MFIIQYLGMCYDWWVSVHNYILIVGIREIKNQKINDDAPSKC